jgi:tetratricopeptide (TPR) repeat protein
LNQGRNKEALERFEEAEGQLKKTANASKSAVPSAYQLNLAMGQAHFQLQSYEKALTKLELAGKENPNSSDVFLYRGACFYKQKDFEKAIKDLEKAIKLDSENVYAYYYAGMTYFEMRQLASAGEVLRIFLKLAPNAPEAPAVKKLVDENC